MWFDEGKGWREGKDMLLTTFIVNENEEGNEYIQFRYVWMI